MPGKKKLAVFAVTGLFAVFLQWLPFCKHTSALDINEDISVDTVWTLADSPVLINKADFTVPVGIRLTIAPGVTVRVKSSIFVYGVLWAVGTSADRIGFIKHDGDSSWDGIHFEYTEGILNESVIKYADLNATGGVNGSINSDRHSVAIDNCSIIVTGDHSKAVYGYGGIVKPEGLAMSFTNSTLTFTSTYDGGYNGKVEAVHLDGFDATISGNTISLSSEAENGWVTAVRLTCSNTEAFTADIFNNDITVTGTHDSIMNIYGIHFDEWEASGEIKNNTFILTGPRSVTGVSTYGADEISGNHITEIITTNYPTAKGYGVYSLASDAGSNDYIFDNTISLSTNQNNVYLYCIYAQCGKIRNNRMTATHSGDSGRVYGLTTDYYQVYIENNSILLSAAGANEYGIAFSTHYNDSKTSVLKNNIIQGSAAATSVGVYKSAGYAASVTNSYNTVYNFTDAHEGLTAGTGSLTSDPEFADALLHVRPGSPAIDAGDWSSPFSNEPAPNGGRINMGAYGNTAWATVSAPSTLYASSDGNCGTKVPCYNRIQDAIDGAATGDIILVRQGIYRESPSLTDDKTLLVKGGYNVTFDQQTRDTTFIDELGPTTIKASSGSLRFEMISVN